MISPGIPNAFLQRQYATFGEAGREWSSRLPALIADYCERWSLTDVSPVPNLSYNWVATAQQADGTPVVLKLGFPNRETRSSTAMLQHCKGSGMVRLLHAEPDASATLLERLLPGQSLWDMPDDAEATAIFTQVASRIWQPAPAEHDYPTVSDWASGLARHRQRYAGETGPIPAHLFDVAEALFRDLLASADEVLLLHGDLHHDNILSATREPWLAIDPKGVIGERAYDTAAFMTNPTPRIGYLPDARRTLHRRVDQMAEALRLDRERVRGYGIAFGVLSGVWSLQPDGTGWEPAVRVAELLQST